MNVAIIGAGFSGLAVTWHLLQQFASSKLNICLFDSKGIGQGTSGIAAGLLHPYAGAHAKLNWRGKEGFDATQDLLKVSSQALGRSVTAKESGILRLALTDAQKLDYKICSERYSQDVEWLNEQACQQLIPGCISAPGLLIREGLTVYSSLYLKGLWLACESLNVKFEQRHILSLKELEAFDIVIITTGAESLKLPEIQTLALKLVKGQVLELGWPKHCHPLTHPLNSHVYMLMSESGTSCLVGATYEKGHTKAQIDIEFAKKEILPKAIELFPALQDAPIINCYAGMRAVTPTHLPLMQRLSSSQWILTGMGSKGLLYHSLFAKELAQSIWQEKML